MICARRTANGVGGVASGAATAGHQLRAARLEKCLRTCIARIGASVVVVFTKIVATVVVAQFAAVVVVIEFGGLLVSDVVLSRFGVVVLSEFGAGVVVAITKSNRRSVEPQLREHGS